MEACERQHDVFETLDAAVGWERLANARGQFASFEELANEDSMLLAARYSRQLRRFAPKFFETVDSCFPQAGEDLRVARLEALGLLGQRAIIPSRQDRTVPPEKWAEGNASHDTGSRISMPCVREGGTRNDILEESLAVPNHLVPGGVAANCLSANHSSLEVAAEPRIPSCPGTFRAQQSRGAIFLPCINLT